MIDVYTANTPNGVKITIALEEMGVPYDLHMIDLGANEQKSPGFLEINPNGRIPAIIDRDGPGGAAVNVWESGAVLLYLAEKYGKLLPEDPALRIEAIAWTYFQTGGIGPIMGQAGWFKRNMPDTPAAFDRFLKESERLVSVMEEALQDSDYLVGDEVTIADIMHIGWLRLAPSYFGLDMSPFPKTTAWVERMLAREGVQRGLSVLKK